ncbi:hypothetical protein [Halostagnicola kamekurae]|uniref:Uncharacterized protein n=1 Tax=Halostagnicola kamekurae TaxID=619731 RepID=A0A1I6UW02_9EURY|nr:hypothetical protein [Halostagnicola kamekurae]SFT05589.1 hypothetical protein SAMN04488556_4135 [Halostagnicola kamekurae]
MTGFKTGASGDDPFDDSSTDDTDRDPDPVDTDPEQSLEALEPSTDETDVSSPATGSLPWLYQRDSITDGRTKTVQLHLQQSTLDEQRDARLSLENDLGETVNKADLREAALLVGLQNLEDVEGILREWGYDVE